MRRNLRWLSVWIIVAAAVVSMRPVEAQRVEATPRQRQQLKHLALATRRASGAERDKIRQARVQLFEAYREYDLDEPKAKASLRRIGESQFRLLRLHLDNQIELRNILDAEQFRRFLEITRKAREDDMDVIPPGDGTLDQPLGRRMLDGLRLSPAQEAKASALHTPGPRKIRAVERIRQDSRRMLELYSEYDLDVPKAKRLIDSIHKSQVELAEINLERQRLLRSVLTKEQFERLQAEMARKMRETMKGRRNRG